MAATRVLVAGATGYLGRYVTRAFHRRGASVRALARSSGKLVDLADVIDDRFIGEVTDAESLRGACEGIDVVFSSIGLTRQGRLTFMDVDYQANRNLLDEALRCGVEKFVYISVLTVPGMEDLAVVRAKRKFLEDLRDCGIDHTVVCPNGYFSDMAEFLAMAARGRGYVFGDGSFRINPIHGADLAELCVTAALEENLREESGSREIRAGGPDVLTHRQILELAFQALHRHPRITSVPRWIPRLITGVLRTFTPEWIYGPIEFFLTVLTRDLVAPAYGTHRLKDYFAELAEAESDRRKSE